MTGTVLFAVVSLAVTNAPSAFSTMVERTFACPVVVEKGVGLKFDLDLPHLGSSFTELAVGHDGNGDGFLSDDEIALLLSQARDVLTVRGRDGRALVSSPYSSAGVPLSLSFRPGRAGASDAWRVDGEGCDPIGQGGFDGNAPVIRALTLARVRVSGPAAASLNVTTKRIRDAFVLTIR